MREAGVRGEGSVDTCPPAATGGNAARLGWRAVQPGPRRLEGLSGSRAGPGQAALGAGGWGLVAWSAFMEVRAAAGGWVSLPPRLPASPLPEPG